MACLEAQVENLRKQLAKKTTFESAVAGLTTLFRERYGSANSMERELMHTAACRAATLLQTRYTSRGFWKAGLDLFEQAESVASSPKEKQDMRKYVVQALEFLGEADEDRTRAGSSSSSYLFEGQLTTAPEPPLPRWLAAQRDLIASEVNSSTSIDQSIATLHTVFNSIVDGLQSGEFAGLQEALEATNFPVVGRRPPPASKDEVAKLPVIIVDEQILKNIGDGTECAVCREAFVVKDEMQEMPCKHYFHPPCLKPWLDEHNSCPICRHELRTDDHEYESRKEREKEEEAARKGAANAVRDGDLMYI